MANAEKSGRERSRTESSSSRGAKASDVGARRSTKADVGRKQANGRPSNVISYKRSEGVKRFVRQIRNATPMQLVEVERTGVSGILLKDMARQINIPVLRLYDIVGVPKATAEKKASENEVIAGAGGQATLGMARLLGIAQAMVENSTSAQAKDFDAAQWLGRWIELPQPALGGRKPADLLDTPTGINVVARVLGAIESGAFV